MRLLTTFAVLAALPLLAGCETGGRQSSAQVAAAAASASGPGPAGTRFDGRYSGPSNLTVGRGNACGSQTGTRTITVRNGVAAMVYDSLQGRSASGPVQADGSVTLRGESDLNTGITGRFANGRFTGELRSGQCVRALNLPRARAAS